MYVYVIIYEHSTVIIIQKCIYNFLRFTELKILNFVLRRTGLTSNNLKISEWGKHSNF
jgi:hypothetical protein